jgi:hypothetical protein
MMGGDVDVQCEGDRNQGPNQTDLGVHACCGVQAHVSRNRERGGAGDAQPDRSRARTLLARAMSTQFTSVPRR